MHCLIKYYCEFERQSFVFGIATCLEEALRLIDAETYQYFGEPDTPDRTWFINVYQPNSTVSSPYYRRSNGVWEKSWQFETTRVVVRLEDEPYWYDFSHDEA